MLRALVIGSAAGGGFPQWNGGGAGCVRARSGDRLARARTQTSLAVSSDGRHWFLLNASPDLRQQIEQTPSLHATGLRGSPIAGVVLTGGEVDAIAGLLTLRERHRFTVFATAQVHCVLEDNPIFEVLARDVVGRREVAPDIAFTLDPPVTADPAPLALRCTLFPVPGKVPLFMEGGAPLEADDGTTVGAMISDGERTLFFVPGCARMTVDLSDRLRGADCVLFDGTLWTDDEMIRAGLGAKTGARMGHMSVDGPDGTIAAFADLDVRQKVLIHINNSNPVLLEDSPEHAAVLAAGWQVAHDGMELVA